MHITLVLCFAYTFRLSVLGFICTLLRYLRRHCTVGATLRIIFRCGFLSTPTLLINIPGDEIAGRDFPLRHKPSAGIVEDERNNKQKQLSRKI